MKQKTGISLILALLMIVSTFTVVGSVKITGEDEDIGEVCFEKTVWNEDSWAEDTLVDSGDTVRFNITVIYYAPYEHPTYILKDIKIRDELPDCLEFANSVTVETTSEDDPMDWFSQEVSGQTIYWNFTSKEPTFKLKHKERLYIEFNATVTEECETGTHYNLANLTSVITCPGVDYYDDDCASVTVKGKPGIDIEKKVWNGTAWADEVTEYVCDGEYTLDFCLKISNTGELALEEVVVTDVLPDFLSYSSSSITPDSVEDNKIVWTIKEIPPEYSVSILLTANIDNMGEDDNYANVTTGDLFDEDSVHVVVYKCIIFEKEVWDPEQQLWVDLLEKVQLGQIVKFRITITYYGSEEFQGMMKCMVVDDYFPDCCLEYVGNEIFTYPNDPDDPLFDDPEITVAGNHITYDWDDVKFNFYPGETITIEFETEVIDYCYDIVDNCAEVELKSCDGCEEQVRIYGRDCASVNCIPQPPTFEKKVLDILADPPEWVDEGLGVVGGQMTFMLQYEYYGEENPTTLIFEDHLPCVLSFTESNFFVAVLDDGVEQTDITGYVEVDVYVSEDETIKIVWFNISDIEVTDGDTVYLGFVTDVIGATGDCEDCHVTNKAFLEVYKCTEEEPIGTYEDEISVKTVYNHAPYTPEISGDTEGKTEDTLTFDVTGTDPNSDDLYYYIDFGDGYEYLGLFEHGETVEVTHAWSEAGEYTVKVKSKDVWGLESVGEGELTVTIEDDTPPSEGFTAKIVGGLSRKVTISLENGLETDLSGVSWNLKVTKKLIGRVLLEDGESDVTLPAGTTEKCRETKRGIGLIKVHLTFNADGFDEQTVTKNGIILGKFIILF